MTETVAVSNLTLARGPVNKSCEQTTRKPVPLGGLQSVIANHQEAIFDWDFCDQMNLIFRPCKFSIKSQLTLHAMMGAVKVSRSKFIWTLSMLVSLSATKRITSMTLNLNFLQFHRETNPKHQSTNQTLGRPAVFKLIKSFGKYSG